MIFSIAIEWTAPLQLLSMAYWKKKIEEVEKKRVPNYKINKQFVTQKAQN